MHIKTIYPQLDTIKFKDSKPLIICDADEVIFNFMDAFLTFLKKKGLGFSWKSYALNGNITDENGIPIKNLDIKKLLKDFFCSNTFNMKLVKGVKNSLKVLSYTFNIVILSNIPIEYYKERKKALKNNQLNYPFIANVGEKGKVCLSIFKKFNIKTWFIDDSPYQIYSVKKSAPKINTILYVENKKLAKLIDKKKCWDYYSNNWKENLNILIRSNYG